MNSLRILVWLDLELLPLQTMAERSRPPPPSQPGALVCHIHEVISLPNESLKSKSDSPSLCIVPVLSFGNAECYRLYNNLFLNWFIMIEKWCFTLNSCMRMLTIWVYIYAARKRENKLNFKLLMFSHSNKSCCVLFVTGTVLHPKLFCLMIKPWVYEACTFFISFMT